MSVGFSSTGNLVLQLINELYRDIIFILYDYGFQTLIIHIHLIKRFVGQHDVKDVFVITKSIQTTRIELGMRTLLERVPLMIGNQKFDILFSITT